MSLQDLEAAFDYVLRHPELAFFTGPVNEETISAAEAALGLRFPDTYRRFVARLGAGNFGGDEIYGVIGIEKINSGIPDVVWATLADRRDFQLPNRYLLIGVGGDDESYVCIDTHDNGRILALPVGYAEQKEITELLHEDFGAFFLSIIEERLDYEVSIGERRD